MYYVEDKQSQSSVLARRSNGNFNRLKMPEDCKKVIIYNSIKKIRPRKIAMYSLKKWRGKVERKLSLLKNFYKYWSL